MSGMLGFEGGGVATNCVFSLCGVVSVNNVALGGFLYFFWVVFGCSLVDPMV